MEVTKYWVILTLNTLIDGVELDSGFKAALDLETGFHTTTFLATDGNNYSTTLYCSNHASVCVYDNSSSGILPDVTIAYGNSNDPFTSILANYTCGDGPARYSGVTQEGLPLGMKYNTLAGVSNLTPK